LPIFAFAMENSPLNLSEIQFGATILYFRKERRMSIGQLADAAGLAQETLKQLESDELHPAEELLLLISQALDIPYQVFILEATLRTDSENKEENKTRSALQPVFNFLTRKLILE
jgi:transcriptional regulator with XRE-family HTH domain